MRTLRLGILSSHPIQYQTPLFRQLARDPRIALKVYFCHDHGVRPSFDVQFGRTIQFDVPQLAGYSYEFLHNLHPRPSTSPSHLINPQIGRVLLQGECDVLVVHGYNTLTSMLAFLGPHGSTKLILRGESNLRRPRSRSILLAKQIYLRLLFSRIDYFLAIGRLNAEYYESYGVSRDRIGIAPYTVDTELFSSTRSVSGEQRRALRRSYRLAEDGLIVLFVGKFMALKRPLDVVRAIQRLPETVSMSLAMIGSGELENEVSEYVEQHRLGERVHLLGFRNQSELPELYRCADVLVLASNTETWGLVVNEAMAAGVVPIVTDQVGCGPDLVDPSCIYPVGDVDALTAILMRIGTDPQWLSELQIAAQARMEKWTLADTADAFVQAALHVHET